MKALKIETDAPKLFNEIMAKFPWLAYKDVNEFVDHAIRKYALELLALHSKETGKS